MKHLEIEQLKKYGERQLNADEITQTVFHLSECRKCFDLFQQIFPVLSDAAREVSFDILTADDAEPFHLDYEAHLRPYIDFEADEVTREIVESHLQNCSFCARAVRELREFSGGLKPGKIEKDDLDEPIFVPRRFSNEVFQYLFLSAALVLILGIGGWLIWRQTDTTTFVAENQPPKNMPEVSANENSFNRLPENTAMNLEVKKNKLPIPPPKDYSTNKKTGTDDNKIPESKQLEDERLIAELPPDFIAGFQNALQTQKISLPPFIADLRENRKLRGESNNEKNIILSPDAQAVRTTRPTFSWQKFAAGDESYIVTIYDNGFNQIAVSPSLRTTKWQVNIPLERGKIYKWEVKIENSDKIYPAQFKILDEDALGRLKTIEKATLHSPLVRGFGYASEGLLTEAEREFQKAIKNDPRNNPARKLKHSLKIKRKN